MSLLQTQRGFLAFHALLVLALVPSGCVLDVENAGDTEGDDYVEAIGVVSSAITTSALLSANGTYGASCAGGRANTSWSIALSMGATLDNTAVTVVRGDTACVLSLTEVRTGTGANNLWAAQAPIALNTTYPATATLFTSPTGTFLGNARLNAATFVSAFIVEVTVSDDPSVNTGSSTANYTYDAYILTKETPLSFWRLNDIIGASDDFTATAGTTLQAKTGGITWTKTNGAATDAVVTNEGRIRSNSTSRATYLSGTTALTADYAVSADLHVKSLITTDQVGIFIRGVAADTYYFAGYRTGIGANAWEIWKYSFGIGVLATSSAATLTANSTYRLFVAQHGATTTLTVDGVQRSSNTDLVAPITAVGAPGVLLGGSSTAPSNTTGMHLDNFILQAQVAADSKGSNTGAYIDYVSLSAAGATNSPGNTAVTWTGSGYVDAARTIADDFSIEFWFNATTVTPSAVTAWYNGAGLVDATGVIGANPTGFGVSVRSDGKVLAGAANSYTCSVVLTCTDQMTIVSSTTPALNTWHHVVFTRTKASGAMVLYVDGASVGTATIAAGVSLTQATRLNIGRNQTGVNYFTGSMDEVSIYNTVLNASAVSAHYARR